MRNGQDLQDGLFKTKQGTNYGQDGRITRFAGLRVGAKLGAKKWTGWQDLGGSGKYHVR